MGTTDYIEKELGNGMTGYVSKPGLYNNYKLRIKSNLNAAADDFFQIGYYLRKMNEDKLYLYGGYSDIWTFAKSEFGLSMSSTSRFMAINERFTVDDGQTMNERYIGMGASKLQEMLTLSDEQIEDITPETTVAQIREIKKEAAAAEELTDEEADKLYDEMINTTWFRNDGDGSLSADNLKAIFSTAGSCGGAIDYECNYKGINVDFLNNGGKHLTWNKLSKIFQKIADERKAAENRTDAETAPTEFNDLTDSEVEWLDSVLLKDWDDKITAAGLKAVYNDFNAVNYDKDYHLHCFRKKAYFNGKEISWTYLADRLSKYRDIKKWAEPVAASQEEAEGIIDVDEDTESVFIAPQYHSRDVYDLLNLHQRNLADYIETECPQTMITKEQIVVDALDLLYDKMKEAEK